jgi:retinol dehydrogenase 14
MNGPMAGKICMVTGANSGIGKVTALELARMGATVVMVCRDKGRAEPVLAEIRRVTGNPSVELMLADFSSQQSIRALATAFKQTYDRLHVLVNNAGAIMFERKRTVDGLESTFATNHLGYFLLTNLLLDQLKAAAPARVVSVSSGAHPFGHINFDDLQGERKWSAWGSYSHSKLANVLFTAELARRLEGTGVTANCLHPGFVRSNFAGASALARTLIKLGSAFSITPEKGAETSIYLATSPEVEGVTGKYFVRKQVARTSREANDPAVARRLWQVSEALTGLGR